MVIIKFRRIESPSSINTFKQCPRKYYYSYILNIPSADNIHTIIGSIVHKTLEEFFKVNPHFVNRELYRDELKFILLDILNTNWKKNFSKINELCNNPYQASHYYGECVFMAESWAGGFFREMDSKMNSMNFVDAFKSIVPMTEVEFKSEELGVRGFIDAIYDDSGEIRIIDYKTSSKKNITSEYRLQLAIYALLYREKHGKAPDRAGINFLRHGIQYLDVDEELLNFAKLEVEVMHLNTEAEKIESYPMKPGPLCRWQTGQCDFYGICFEGRKPNDLKKEMEGKGKTRAPSNVQDRNAHTENLNDF